MATHNIKGVEVFSTGTWNGTEITADTLVEMVSAFEETKDGVRPFLKLGHDDKQNLIQRDGFPAAGWIERLYVSGEKLLADFSDIPDKIYKLIQDKAYRKVSCEVYSNIKIKDKLYKNMLGAVALLGANTPGVMNLSDILSMYTNTFGEIEPTIYDLEKDIFGQISNHKNKGDDEMELEAIKQEYTEKLDAQKKEMDALQAAADQAKKEIEDLKAFKVEAEKEKQRLAFEAQVAKNEKFVSDLTNEQLCSPSMKPFIVELLGESKQEYSIEDKKLSKEELIKEMLKLSKAAQDVNLESNSSKGDYSKDKDAEAEMDKKAKEYAAQHKVSYGAALKEVMKKK